MGSSRRIGVKLFFIAAAVGAVTGVVGLAFRGEFTKLFGPPPVEAKESYTANPDSPGFDHSMLDEVLRAHVDDRGLVDYAALHRDPAKLDQYIAALQDAPFEALGRDEKLVLLINAYNAFTLRLILDHYPVASIRDIPGAERWDAVRWQVGKQTWSLNQIEHEQVRPHFVEPRIHFALVCAAIGCPPLRPEAYTVERLEEQLAAQTEYVHMHPRWFRYEPGSDTVHLTQLYKWYGGDFEQTAGSVLSYVANYAPSLTATLERGEPPAIDWLDYDWSLNAKTNAGKIP